MHRTRLFGMVLATALLLPAAAAAEDIKYFLANTGVDADAMGKARFRDKKDKQRFEVKVSSMTPGAYEVTVGAGLGTVNAGPLEVNADGDGRLRIEGTPLPLDPRGQSVKVKDGFGIVYFDSILPLDEETAKQKIKVREKFDYVGAGSKAKGDAKYSSRKGKTKFDVKIKDLAVGPYNLYVNNAYVTTIDVIQEDDGDTIGKVKFDSRFARDDKQVLTFDPLCQPLSVRAQGTFTDLLTIAQFGSSSCN